MKKRNVFEEMPIRFTSAMRKRDTDAAIRRAKDTINTNAAKLSAMRELPELPKEIGLVNKDFVISAITPRVDAVKRDISLTEEERDERLQAWLAIRRKAMGYVSAITDTLNEWPEVKWEWNEENNAFLPTNADEVIETRSTFEVPAEAKKHYSLIQAALAAIIELRQWEWSQDCRTVPLAELVRIRPTQLAEIWQSGGAKLDRRFQHLGINPDNNKGTIII